MQQVVEKMIEADNAKPPAQRKFAAPQTQQDMRDSATEKDERDEETNEHSLRNMNRQNHSLYSLRLTDATRNSPLTDRKFDHELDGMTRPLQGRTSQAAFMYYQMSPFFSDTYVVVHTGHLDTFVSESMGKVRDSLSVVMKPDGDSDVPPIATLIALAAGVANGDHGTDVTILSGQALAVRGGVPFTARSFDVTMSVMYHLPATWLQDGKGLTMVVAFLEEIVGLAHADGAWDIVTPPFEEIGADHFDGLVQRDSVVGTALASVVPHATACALFKAIQEDVRRVLQRAATHVDYDKYGPDDAAFDRLGHAIKLLHCARPTYEQYGLDVCDCDDVNSADVAANVIAFRAGFTQ